MLTIDEAQAGLHRARFSGDINLHDSIRGDDQLGSLMEQASRRGGGHVVRRNLLATAVRVDPRLLPSLQKLTSAVAERANIAEPLEFYVYASPEINACVCRGKEHLLVMLSSAAVQSLTTEELEFVVGHELGHALYGHLDMPVTLALNSGASVSEREAMKLLAWQRKAEISADRAGLVCCGCLDTAATAMFKLLSGLSIDGLKVNPHEFADQWADLAREVSLTEGGGAWGLTHPFPTLRMKAMIHFWETGHAADMIDTAAGDGCLSAADREIESLLALMDPLARESGECVDPLMAPVFLWGGLFVATQSGATPQQFDAVRGLCGSEAFASATASGTPDAPTCRAKFEGELSSRRKGLSARELHRLFTGLAGVAHAAPVQEIAMQSLRDLAGVCGVDPKFVDGAVRQAA